MPDSRSLVRPHRLVNRLIVAFSLLFVVGLSAVAVVLYVGSRELDAQREIDSGYYAELALKAIEDEVGLLAKDNSWWDEMIIHALHQLDYEWLRKTYIPYLWDELEISDMLVIDTNNQTLFAIHEASFSSVSASQLFSPAVLDELMGRARSAAAEEPEAVNGLAMVGDQVMVVSASALTPEEEGSVELPEGPRAVLIMLKPFSVDLFGEHSRRLVLNELSLKPDLNGELVLKDLAGQPIGSLEWHVIPQAQRMLERSMPMLLAVAVVMFLLAGIVLLNARRARDRLRILSLATEQAGESIVITDRDGHIVYVNPSFERLTGYGAAEVMGQKPSVLKSGKHSKAYYENLWQTITHGHTWQSRTVDRHKDGELYPVMMSITPIMDDRGSITHYVGIQQSLSEYEQMEQQFMQAQKLEAIGVLAGGIAHNFNNILAGIDGYVYLLKQDVKGQENALRRIGHIHGLSQQAAQAVSQLLTFSRKALVDMRKINLNELIQDSLKLIRILIPENVRMDVTMPTTPIHVKGDYAQLQQILLNLATNARDAMDCESEPVMHIRLDWCVVDEVLRKRHPALNADRYALLSVCDNGCGMDEECLSQLFDPYFTTKNVGEGTGLGLAMVFGAVKTHGGYITVESEPECGARFDIYLPELIDSADLGPTDEPVASYDDIIEMGNGECILLADDAPQVLKPMSAVLEQLNYRVITAENGRRALEQFEKHRPELALVILDVVMPELGGVEVAEKLRLTAPDMPVIFLTGYDQGVASEISARIGNCQLYSKPLSTAKLAAAIWQLLNRS